MRHHGGYTVPDPVNTIPSAANCALVDGMSLLNMMQLNSVPNARGRTLDLVFINEEFVSDCQVHEAIDTIIDADSFHPALLVALIAAQPAQFSEPIDDRTFDFRKADFVGLNTALLNCNWTWLDTIEDIDQAVNYFNQTLTTLFRRFIPSPRAPPKPKWSNNRLRYLKRKRAATLRKYSNLRSVENKHAFIAASNEYKYYNRRLYSAYVNRTQNYLRRNPKRFWSFVNEKRKESGLPSSMFLSNSNVSSNLQEICNLFATHFASVFNCSVASTEQIHEALHNVPHDVFTANSLSQFTEENYNASMVKLKSSFSPGPDGIPSVVLKRCATALRKPLLTIFNFSLSQSKFPTEWKKSHIFPVFKKGDKRDISNYRGITSLCSQSKLLEIMVSSFLFNCAKQYISVDQHGFYPGRSVNTNLVEFTSFCLRNIEQGIQIDTVYTDLKAAFDRIDHRILLAKLHRLGTSINLVRWLESYLINRSLSTKIGSTESQTFTNSSGVPQGSNLGPLLFCLYFNDVCFVIPSGCRLLYADDLKIFLLIRCIDDCRELQKLVDAFVRWCTSNRLSISVSKCTVISFTRRKTPFEFLYRIGETPVPRETVVKDLGVLLDTKLSYQNHYNSIISRAYKNLGFIFRTTREFRDPYCLRALYYSLVRSTLETTAVVCNPYTDVWSSRMESVQSKFVRYALRFLPWTNPLSPPPYESRCLLLGMNTLASRRNYLSAAFIGKLLLGVIDAPKILEMINVNAGARILRSRNFLYLSSHRTTYGQNEPVRAMCDIFNRVYHLFDFSDSPEMFLNRLRVTNVL